MAAPLLCAVLGVSSTPAQAQTTPAQTPAQGRQTTPAPPAQPRPATPTTQAPPATGQPAAPATAPPPRRPAAPASVARGGVAIFVTDMTGMPIRDVRVAATGPTERSGTTDGGGRLTITGVQAGTYRLRFSNPAVTDFEREVIVRGGSNAEVDVSLRPAPPPVIVTAPAPAPPPAPAAPAAVVGPIGQPQALSVVELIDKAFLDGPRREALISCSGNTRVTLLQMSQDQPTRLYQDAEVTYYVLGGEGTARVGGRETLLKQDSFVSVPRGVSHAIVHRGRRPLVLMTQLSGEPCEQAK